MIASPNSQRGAVLALLATIVLWAYSWVVMKQVLAYAGPFDFAALRYLLGAAVLFAALLLARQSLQPPPLLPTILIGLCQTAAFQGLDDVCDGSGTGCVQDLQLRHADDHDVDVPDGADPLQDALGSGEE